MIHMTKTNTLCVIPARGGSKSVPLKNIAMLKGKPLLHYALSAALKSQSIDRVVVSSDHEGILATAASYGEGIALRRPEELARDDTPSYPVVLHALKTCEEENNCRYDYIVLVQATNPLVLADDIDMTIRKMIESSCDSVVTVSSLGYMHPSKFKTLEGDRLLAYIEEERELVSRQFLQEVYVRNGSCYAVTRPVLLEGDLVGKDVRAVVVPKERYVDINDMVDMKIAECLLG